MPQISVITINYNNRDGLRKTIESVVNQTWHGFEYIIIDGGSTDGSIDVIKQYSDRIDYWVSEPDKGIYNAMNKGIDVAKGEYCIFLNSGDYFLNKSVLQECSAYLGEVDIVSGCVKLSSGDVWPVHKSITLNLFYEGHSLNHPASFIKRYLLQKYHYDERLRIVADWKFFIQTLIIDNSGLLSMDVIVAVFDTNGISSSNFLQIKRERAMVLEEMFPDRLIEDYNKNHLYDFRKLFFQIEKHRMHTLIYVSVFLIFRLLNLFTGRAKWIREFGFKEKYKL